MGAGCEGQDVRSAGVFLLPWRPCCHEDFAGRPSRSDLASHVLPTSEPDVVLVRNLQFILLSVVLSDRSG